MESDPSSQIVIYRAGSHPNGKTRRGLFGVEMVRPLGITMLPVMIGTLVAMLQGLPVLAVLYIGFPISLSVAFLWTWIHLRSEICEILISEHKIAVRSVFAAALPLEDLQWKLLIDFQGQRNKVLVTIGLEEFTLIQADWPEWSRLTSHLQATLHQTMRRGSND